jgi:hypothetical protein
VEDVKKLEGAEKARAARKLMEEGIIFGDEYREMVSVEDELQALGERFAPQSPQQRDFDRIIGEREKAGIIAELKKLIDSGDMEGYREKYEEYIKDKKITEDDLVKARNEGRF